jgi:peptide chain release factor 3
MKLFNRLEHEYGAKCTYENFPVHKACWVKPMMQRIMNSKNLNELNKVSSKRQIRTIGFLADSDFTIQTKK